MLKKLFITAILMVSLYTGAGTAQIEVDITEGTYKPFPIAIPDLNAQPGAEAYALEISEIIRNNLVSTGLFALVDPAAFIQKDLDIRFQPRFADWQMINADALVVGEVGITPDGRLSVALKLWDINGKTEFKFRIKESETGEWIDDAPGAAFVLAIDKIRRLAHKSADTIYSRLTGASGVFDSRIVYIAETGPKIARVKRLAIMDSDGANQQFLTSGRNQMLTPRFSTSDQEITYMSFDDRRPRVYIFDLQTGRQEALGDFQGMTFAPRFSPDGDSITFSQAERGNTDLYVMNLRTREIRRLTEHPAIDTSPSMSADGTQIAFTSDRGGSPQIYIMNTDGSPLTCPSGGSDIACRITFGEGIYSTPVWSPRGDLIAFTKQLRRRFHIGVIGTDGRGERLLSEAYLDEGPAWSPNGRVITFFRETRPGSGPRLYSVDLTGRNLREIETTTDASDPAWSPLLE